MEYVACLDSGLVPNLNSSPCPINGTSPQSERSRGAKERALPECQHQPAAGSTPTEPSEHLPPAAPNEVPAAGTGKRSDATWKAQGARRATPSPLGARAGRGAAAARCLWDTRRPPPAPKPRLSQQSETETLATSGRCSPPCALPARPATPRPASGAAELPPPRSPGAAAPGPRPPGHSLLHSSSAQSLCSEKRRSAAGLRLPGTRQGGPSRSSQRSSPGAAAMLWSPLGSRRRGGGGRGGRRGRGAEGRRLPEAPGFPADTSARPQRGTGEVGGASGGARRELRPAPRGLVLRALPWQPGFCSFSLAQSPAFAPVPSQSALRATPAPRSPPLSPWDPQPRTLPTSGPFWRLLVASHFWSVPNQPALDPPFLVWYLLFGTTKSHARFAIAGSFSCRLPGVPWGPIL